MSVFRRKGKSQDAEPAPEDVAPAEPGDADPSAWSLPADAEGVAPATAAGGAATAREPEAEEEPPEPEPKPAAAAEAEPEREPERQPAAGVTGAGGAPADAPTGGPLAAILSSPTVQRRPELVVAGAFVGAFLVARILKRLSE